MGPPRRRPVADLTQLDVQLWPPGASSLLARHHDPCMELARLSSLLGCGLILLPGRGCFPPLLPGPLDAYEGRTPLLLHATSQSPAISSLFPRTSRRA